MPIVDPGARVEVMPGPVAAIGRGRSPVWGVQSLGPAGITIRLVATTKPLEQWRITIGR